MPYDGPYDKPEAHGLEIIASLDWTNEPHTFDAWYEPKTGNVYIAHDSGCSCPSPFEDYSTVKDLERIKDTANLEALIKKTKASGYGVPSCFSDDARLFVDKINEALKKKKKKVAK